jgi:hypothetical protein
VSGLDQPNLEVLEKVGFVALFSLGNSHVQIIGRWRLIPGKMFLQMTGEMLMMVLGICKRFLDVVEE